MHANETVISRGGNNGLLCLISVVQYRVETSVMLQPFHLIGCPMSNRIQGVF